MSFSGKARASSVWSNTRSARGSGYASQPVLTQSISEKNYQKASYYYERIQEIRTRRHFVYFLMALITAMLILGGIALWLTRNPWVLVGLYSLTGLVTFQVVRHLFPGKRPLFGNFSLSKEKASLQIDERGNQREK